MSTPVRARLYDAEGHDRDVEIEPGMVSSLEDRQLLWIDVGGRDREDLERVAAATVMGARLTGRLARETGCADLTLYPDHIHLVTEAMDPASSGALDASPARELDLVAGRNWIVTVHSGAMAALDSIDELTDGETRFGALDAASFLASIVDEVLAGYLNLAEEIEREIDQLDERALKARRDDDVCWRDRGRWRGWL